MRNKIKEYFNKWISRIALGIVVLAPIIEWVIQRIKTKPEGLTNPYTMGDFHLILIFSVLNLIYEQISTKKEVVGDESNILLNRNQSDYYEIWEVCKKSRQVAIDAYGHSFKTLWFNFVRKFLNEVIINSNHYDMVTIRLVSTKKGNNCFEDIKDFYNSLTPEVAKKVGIDLVEIDQMSFFTAISVNHDYLWMSIREPHRTSKMNEHVREWKRKNNETSAKMLEWFSGIMDYYCEKEPVVKLTYNQPDHAN